jgi:hypothetical protein
MVWCLSLQSIFAFVSKKSEKRTKEKEKKSYHEIEYIQKKIVKIKKANGFLSCIAIQI